MNVRIASATTMRSGVITSRMVTREASRSSSCMAIRLLHQALDVGHHALVGQREIKEGARERAGGVQ